MTNLESRRFLIGCSLGDGCLHRNERWGTVTLHINRKQQHRQYAEWQLSRLNKILGTKATLKSFLSKGKYRAVRFGVSSKKLLTPIYDLVYPDGKKTFSEKVLSDLGLQELALFWMDDGSLEVRKRISKTGNVKIERSGWLAVCEDEPTTELVGSWIQSLTGSRHTKIRHRSGKFYLRWHSKQCRNLIEKIKPYVHPCIGYKVDLTRTGTVSDWLSESYLHREEDDKATRVPRTLLNSFEG